MQTFGVVSCTDHQCSCGVGSDAEAPEKLGTESHEERFDPRLELGQLAVEALHSTGERAERGLGRALHRFAVTSGTEASCFAGECGHGQSPQTASQLVGGSDDELAHLDERGGAGHSGRAFGDDEGSDPLDGTVFGLGDALRLAAEGRSGRLDGVEGIGLATAAPLLPVGRFTSITATPAVRRYLESPAP